MILWNRFIISCIFNILIVKCTFYILSSWFSDAFLGIKKIDINQSTTIDQFGNISISSFAALNFTNGSMDTSLFNHTHQALVLYTVGLDPSENMSDVDVNVTRSISRLSSPLAVTIAVLLVFLFSPMILIGNSLVLVAMYRFKRLRTASNYLVMSLATSDLGIGMFMPVGMYLELGGARNFTSAKVCLLSYGVAITLCCVSVLVMVAIAVDRFTSLARPLRYPNLITHSSVERYIIVFWAYASLVGFTPLGYSVFNDTNISTE